MALPKYKTSRANIHTRRSAWKADATITNKCPNCGRPTLQHAACPFCGYWRGQTYKEAIKYKK